MTHRLNVKKHWRGTAQNRDERTELRKKYHLFLGIGEIKM